MLDDIATLLNPIEDASVTADKNDIMTQKVKEKVTFATRGAIDEGCMAKYSNRKQLLCCEIRMKISVGGKELEKTKLFERVLC